MIPFTTVMLPCAPVSVNCAVVMVPEYPVGAAGVGMLSVAPVKVAAPLPVVVKVNASCLVASAASARAFSTATAAATKASVAISEDVSPGVCVAAVVPFGSNGVPLRLAAVPVVFWFHVGIVPPMSA